MVASVLFLNPNAKMPESVRVKGITYTVKGKALEDAPPARGQAPVPKVKAKALPPSSSSSTTTKKRPAAAAAADVETID